MGMLKHVNANYAIGKNIDYLWTVYFESFCEKCTMEALFRILIFFLMQFIHFFRYCDYYVCICVGFGMSCDVTRVGFYCVMIYFVFAIC